MNEVLLTIELDEDGNLVLVNPEGHWIVLSDKDTQNLLDIVYSDSDIAHESWGRVARKIRDGAKSVE